MGIGRAFQFEPDVGNVSDSKLSAAYLQACHPALKRLLYRVSERVDFTLIYGYLGMSEQCALYSEDKSRLLYSSIKHNCYPGMAVGVAPCGDAGIALRDEDALLRFACVVFECAAEIGVRVRWGGNSQTFRNMQHWELMTDHD